jgi:hypothetical protein
MTALLSRDLPDQPCNCFRDPHAFYCAKRTVEIVPGYVNLADGQADAADQHRDERIGGWSENL